jgi:hypothetical protein
MIGDPLKNTRTEWIIEECVDCGMRRLNRFVYGSDGQVKVEFDVKEANEKIFGLDISSVLN